MPDDSGDQRGWRQQIEDLLRDADLPAPPAGAKRRGAEPSDDELRAQYSVAMSSDHLEAIATIFTLQAAKRLINPVLFNGEDAVADNWQAFYALQAAHFLHGLISNYLAMQRSMLAIQQNERRYFESMAERLDLASKEVLLSIRNVVPESSPQPDHGGIDLEKEIQRSERLLEQIDLLVAGIRRRKPHAANAFDALDPPIGLL